jgi:RNA polymerase sigma-B factor
VVEAREVAAVYRLDSLDQSMNEEGEAFMVSLGVDDDGYAQTEAAAAVEPLLSMLTYRQRQVLHLRFHHDLTQAEIGSQIGVSQMHVSRLLRETIEELRDAADSYMSA